MNKISIEYHHFARWVGIVLIVIGILMAVNVIAMGIMGFEYATAVKVTIQFLIYGIVVYGIGRLVQYIELNYMEMKFFRRHYIEKNDETARVLQNKENKDG